MDPFELAYRQAEILPAHKTGGWNLEISVDRVQRIIHVGCRGLRVLQSVAPGGQGLFTDQLRLDVRLQNYHPTPRPLVIVTSPIAHPHVCRNGQLCYDGPQQLGWLRLSRDVGLVVAWHVLPLLLGQPSLIAHDVFTQGKEHMSTPLIAWYYRAHRPQLPWDGRALFRRF